MLPTVISLLALAISIATAWLTLFKRGKLRVTKPTLIAFVYEAGKPGIFLRALLYTTGKAGHVIEGMYLVVTHENITYSFNYWMFVETNALKIGSGMHIRDEGVAFDHHFRSPRENTTFAFLPGEYAINIYARVVDNDHPILLQNVVLSLTVSDAKHLSDRAKKIHFVWEHDSQRYHSQIV